MDGSQDPFRILSVPYDASPEDVRRAFRRLAQKTHPDRGGSADAFHSIRVAYGALTDDIERQRGRWAPKGLVSPYAAGLDPRIYPTCRVRLDRTRDGKQIVAYEVNARPRGWTPGAVPPPGGTCKATVEATGDRPAFGVWVVPLDESRYRCVFGPPTAER